MKFPFLFFIFSFFTLNLALADETVKEKAQEAGNDTKRAAKNATREVEEKTCELINGKMECAIKKVKHPVQKSADKIEDAVD